MTDFNLTPAQSGILDELAADPVTQTEDAVLAKKQDGTMVEITPEGEVRDPTEAPPQPEPEVIDGEAEEIPDEETIEDPELSKPPAAALAVDIRDSQDVYRAMDRNDEVMILEEIQGRALDTFVYSFKLAGKLTTDLTVSGVSEVVRLMNERGGCQIGISEQPPIVEEFREGDEDFYRVLVYARDGRQAGSGRWGTAVEPKMMELKDGTKKWDKFAMTKALNKAERNALKKQIPEDFRQTVIHQYLGTHHVLELKPLAVTGGGAVAELPPALDDERAQAIKAEIHDAYKRLRALNKLKLPPARFNAFLTKAETESHERLEVFRDSILDWITEEEKRLAAVEATS